MKFQQFCATAKSYATKFFKDAKGGVPPLDQAGYRHANAWYFVVSTEDKLLHIFHTPNVADTTVVIMEATLASDGIFSFNRDFVVTQAEFEGMAE